MMTSTKRERRELSKETIEYINKKMRSNESFKETMDRILGLSPMGFNIGFKKKLLLTINLKI